jgi:type VI protein secretion system component VasK
MTSGTDARRLFTTDEVVPGMFTRQAWEGDSAGHRKGRKFSTG